jgi:thiamine biosynthesis lipoprotein
MPLRSDQPLDRAQPLFGALARVRACGCPHAAAMEATSAALAVMREVERRMSFHDEASELSALNRLASRRPVAVSAWTLSVIIEALDIARSSAGDFDPTVAPLAVRAGRLPWPRGAGAPDPNADWRDVEVDRARGTVSFRRPLWLDLGGVAKGWAVDAAARAMQRHGVVQGLVDAGGDLRAFGPQAELVFLDHGHTARERTAVRLADRSLASSGGEREGALAAGFDPHRRRRVRGRFVSVMASRCVVADALTKVVLVRGRSAGRLLARYGAAAAIYSPREGWSTCGAAP